MNRTIEQWRNCEHHEEQRDLWANEWNADADQARYHEERRNLALFHLMMPNTLHDLWPENHPNAEVTGA